MKPLGKENPGGWGVKLGKTLRGGGGGVWIFSGTTHSPTRYFTSLVTVIVLTIVI